MKKELFLIFCCTAVTHTMEQPDTTVTTPAKEDVFLPEIIDKLTPQQIALILGTKKHPQSCPPEGRPASPTAEAVLENQGDFTLDQVKAALGKKKSSSKLDATYLEGLCVLRKPENPKFADSMAVSKGSLRSKSCS